MPSTSAKQHRFMEAVAHGMKPRKGGPSQAVAKEFAAADKETNAFSDQVKRRSSRVKARRNRS